MNGSLIPFLSQPSVCLCSRSKSVALHTVATKNISSDDGDVAESGDLPASVSLSETDPHHQENDKSPFKADIDGSQLANSSVSHPSIIHIESENLPETVKENDEKETPETTPSPVEYQDKLYLHLKENLSQVKAYAVEIGKKIPVPDQCTIEGKCSELLKLEKVQTSLKKKCPNNINCYAIFLITCKIDHFENIFT